MSERQAEIIIDVLWRILDALERIEATAVKAPTTDSEVADGD